MTSASLGRILIYTKRIDDMVAFYHHHFGYQAHRVPSDRIVELRPPSGGAVLMLHPLSASRKEGQTLVKLVFDVPDVAAAATKLTNAGVAVGPTHQADGYEFANFKDPAKNNVQISSRGFVGRR